MSNQLYGIGFADSGVGALLFSLDVYRALVTRLIALQREYEVEFVFYHWGDSEHAPFGSKSVPELYGLTENLLGAFGQKPGMRQLVLACNTASTVLDTALLDRFFRQFPGIVLHEMVEKSAVTLYDAAVANVYEGQTKLVIGLLSTPATLISQQFQRALRSIHARRLESDGVMLEIVSYAPEHWASLVEEGQSADIVKQVVAQDLRQWHTNAALQNVSVIGLFCTHFPFLQDYIRVGLQRLGCGPVSLLSQSGLYSTAILQQIDRDFSVEGYRKRDTPADRVSYPCLYSHITGNNSAVVQMVVERYSADLRSRVIVV